MFFNTISSALAFILFISLTLSICRQLVVLIPAAWLLSQTGNVNMVWWSFVIAELVSVVMSFALFAQLNKKIIAPLYN